MSAELVGILDVGAALLVGLGGLILTIGGWGRGDLRALAVRVSALERGQARIVGMLEGAGLFRAAEPSRAPGD